MRIPIGAHGITGNLRSVARSGMDLDSCVAIVKIKEHPLKGMKRSLLFLIPILLCSLDTQREVDKDTVAVIQASYIYNIAKLIEWENASDRSGNFVIGVLSGSNVYQELVKKYSTKFVGKQPIEIQKLPRSASVPKCHILFVGRDNLDIISDVYNNVSGKSTLVITEYSGALEDGSVVNFMVVDNTLRYEISLSNAKAHDLKVGSTLKQMAERVIG